MLFICWFVVLFFDVVACCVCVWLWFVFCFGLRGHLFGGAMVVKQENLRARMVSG